MDTSDAPTEYRRRGRRPLARAAALAVVVVGAVAVCIGLLGVTGGTPETVLTLPLGVFFALVGALAFQDPDQVDVALAAGDADGVRGRRP